MSEETRAESPLKLFLENGRQLPVHQCDCGHCKAEWYVPGLSEEWTPNYCPFCGIKFIRHVVGPPLVELEE